ncbi:MAG: metallophosphoesterase [Defluviitaleaceae bacterium]|nr:metallophosphoesterase [Defluviitaleaceae bacterium]
MAKKILAVILAAIMVIGMIHIAHALTLDRIIQYVEVSFLSSGVPMHMDGYRIAFIADIHNISPQRLDAVVGRLNAMDIDLVLLGGDIHANEAATRRIIGQLAQIDTVDGFFGVEGNHDSRNALSGAMEEYGMTFLLNSGTHIRENFYVGGVGDLWKGSTDVGQAMAEAEPNDFVILLTHNPDVVMGWDVSGADLVLAGHTHGGQITFFGMWVPYFTFTNNITNYGRRFKSGWAYCPAGTPVYVTRGVGEYLPRVFARPQVIIFTLVVE